MENQLGVVPVLVLHDFLIAVRNLLDGSPVVEACARIDIKLELAKRVGLLILHRKGEFANGVFFELKRKLDLTHKRSILQNPFCPRRRTRPFTNPG